jgi:hypothetical protein
MLGGMGTINGARLGRELFGDVGFHAGRLARLQVIDPRLPVGAMWR